MEQRKRPRSGRPPAGRTPGERVADYPQLSSRIPRDAFEHLQALATIRGVPQWRVLADALDGYVKYLTPDEQGLVEEWMRRAEPILAQPMNAGLSRRADAARVTILNVDDNEPMLFARSTMLRTEGFHVLEAQTGRAALQILEAHVPRLVLLDVHLPDMSGIDVCRHIKADTRLRGVKVVQTSATFNSPHDQLEGLQAGGADLYLAEPISRGTLLSIVRRLLDQPTPNR
jgi:CheY-like chemotaxis protein